MLREIYKRIFNNTDKPIKGAVYFDKELGTIAFSNNKETLVQVTYKYLECTVPYVNTSEFNEGDRIYAGPNGSIITIDEEPQKCPICGELYDPFLDYNCDENEFITDDNLNL